MKHQSSLCTLSLVTLSLVSLSLQASTYYASPNGLGDGSSYFSPTTFAQGVSLLQAGGDTLYLREGTYTFTDKFSINKQGNATQNIVISGYPGDEVTLDFSAVPYGTRGITVHANSVYIHIKDLAIAWSGKNNLYNEGSNCIFENLDIYGSADTGCQMKKGGNNLIINVDSHDNFDYETMSGSTANFGGNADGFADKQFTGPGNHYIGCRAWNNSDDGWDFFQRVSTSETVIEDCICYRNGPLYYDMSSNPRALGVDKDWFDSKVNTQMTDRYGNTITISLEQYPCQGNGNGFKMGGQYTDHQILIHHSLAVGNYARGFDQNNNGGTMWVYNNSSYANAYNYGFTTAYGTNYMRNNISLNSKNTDSYKSQNQAANEYNSWNTGFSCSTADFQSLDTTQILAPRASDGSLSDGTFMRLADGSALIDAGVIIDGLDYMGDAPDLGCYETDGIIRPYVKCTSDNLEQWISQNDAIDPIVFTWGGTATGLNYSILPSGITASVDTDKQTLTLSGTPSQSGTFTITVTTVSDLDNPSLTATIHIKSAQAHRVAFVTLPNSTEDALLLSYLQKNDSFLIVQTNATDASVDYSNYEVIVLGSKPNSSAAGFTPLKGYGKPMLLLKPFLLKASVWNWGNSVNTQDLSIQVTNTEHPIFKYLEIANGELQLFSSCNTNAVTAISTWINTEGVKLLATPTSDSTYTTIAEFPVGTDCNGTVLSEKMLMIGISEYSTENLTHQGLRLVENAIAYLLGIDIPTAVEQITTKQPSATKFIQNGKLYIQAGDAVYDSAGRRINR